LALTAVDRVLGAVGCRLDVLTRAANGVAGRNRDSTGDNQHGGELAKHGIPPGLMG